MQLILIKFNDLLYDYRSTEGKIHNIKVGKVCMIKVTKNENYIEQRKTNIRKLLYVVYI